MRPSEVCSSLTILTSPEWRNGFLAGDATHFPVLSNALTSSDAGLACGGRLRNAGGKNQPKGRAFMKLEFHHINFVSEDVDRLHQFYTQVLGLDDIPIENFPRPDETDDKGYSGKIRFATDGGMQMHLAEKNLDVAFKHGETINPVERGHIAFRTDDIEAFKKLLGDNGVPYSDYGTAFAKEWHQLFFHDPEGNIIEVHQAL